MQVFLRKKEEKRVERDRGRNRERDLERVYRPKKSLQIYSL